MRREKAWRKVAAGADPRESRKSRHVWCPFDRLPTSETPFERSTSSAGLTGAITWRRGSEARLHHIQNRLPPRTNMKRSRRPSCES
ncbi:hypothetical protein MCB86_06535 [Pseudomonas sp. KSR10]|nr:hypothetical protein [Pseudomonas sp. KSR10]